MWPPRRPHLEFNDGYYEKEVDTKLQPERHWKSAWRRANPFIDAKAGVDRDAIRDEGTDDENNDSDCFIVADDVDY